MLPSCRESIKTAVLLVPKFARFDRCVHTVRLKPNYTSVNYNVSRGGFAHLQKQHLYFFRDLLGEHRMISDTIELEKYNVDWFNNLRGCSSLVLKPKTTQEVSQILSFCNQENLAVSPQAGNTSVVGGSVPVFDEIILSTELMNKIISIDDTSGVVVCQAGCVLENLDTAVAEKGLMVPLDLGAKGSCQIGGNVSTNAGGLRLFRYGNMHGNVLGLEAVTADGNIIECLGTLKKDNTGYHLKHLFIGSEGTLGIITKVAIQCTTRPTCQNVAFLGAQNFRKVLKTFKLAKQDLGEILSAIEVMDSATMEFIGEKLNINSPIGDYPFYLLLETSGSNTNHDSEKIFKFLEIALNSHFILNGTVAVEHAKINALWSVRERIPEGFNLCGHLFCYDVSLPVENYFILVDEMKIHMGSLADRVFGFGHLGDGNLHLQIETKEFSQQIKDHLEPYIFKRTAQFGGSISAEHGMGFLKAKYLNLARPPSTVNFMKDIKQMFDPKGILNPYKVFP
ncbi:hypothetical protein NQ317_005520 [Molorchus minor]|uniref:D-2-hydroxyglutarate dehydrogenase, mitochondrial n=1 Tax=Molorchus minor TaxID=1323400 RepID=A0ABQ9J2H5_9CUCU|nr:hypothetical protein NQ317_005520 [Molorchus minor]